MTWNFTEYRRTILGVVLIGFGAVLLAAQFFDNAASFLWPVFIVLPGAALVIFALSSAGQARKLAIPGTVIAGIGLILFFQNTFDHYESWAYAWALIPFSIGLGTLLSVEEGGPDDTAPEKARTLMTWSLTVFLILAMVFELLIFGGGGFAARYLVPVVLIVGGALVLLGWSGAHRGSGTGGAD